MKQRTRSEETIAKLEQAAKSGPDARYVLRLYVAGLTPRSVASIQSVKQTCDEYLEGRYDLQVIDIYKEPTLAKGEQIIAAPTLIRKLPLPLRRLIGNMADKKKILVGLDLREKKDGD